MSRILIFGLLIGSLAAQAAVDPTQPPLDQQPSVTENAAAAPGLQAILRGIQGSRAVIDGQSLRVNDVQNGIRVLAIHPQSVLIERLGQRLLLRLAEPVMQPSR